MSQKRKVQERQNMHILEIIICGKDKLILVYYKTIFKQVCELVLVKNYDISISTKHFIFLS